MLMHDCACDLTSAPCLISAAGCKVCVVGLASLAGASCICYRCYETTYRLAMLFGCVGAKGDSDMFKVCTCIVHLLVSSMLKCIGCYVDVQSSAVLCWCWVASLMHIAHSRSYIPMLLMHKCVYMCMCICTYICWCLDASKPRVGRDVVGSGSREW